MNESTKDLLEELKKIAAEKNERQCPSCGHCPACGRGGYLRPWPYYPKPYYTGPVWIYDPNTGPTYQDTNLPSYTVTC